MTLPLHGRGAGFDPQCSHRLRAPFWPLGLGEYSFVHLFICYCFMCVLTFHFILLQGYDSSFGWKRSWVSSFCYYSLFLRSHWLTLSQHTFFQRFDSRSGPLFWDIGAVVARCVCNTKVSGSKPECSKCIRSTSFFQHFTKEMTRTSTPLFFLCSRRRVQTGLSPVQSWPN